MAYSLLQGETRAGMAWILHMHTCAHADLEADGPCRVEELPLSGKPFCVLRRLFPQLGLA